MKTVNKVEIQGYVGRDAAQSSERAPFKFSVATGNDNKPDGSGKYPLCFHNVTVWPDHLPEAKDIRKGDFVRITGRLNYTQWTDKDGLKRTRTEIVASSITLNPTEAQTKQPKPLTPDLGISDADIPF